MAREFQAEERGEKNAELYPRLSAVERRIGAAIASKCSWSREASDISGVRTRTMLALLRLSSYPRRYGRYASSSVTRPCGASSVGGNAAGSSMV